MIIIVILFLLHCNLSIHLIVTPRVEIDTYSTFHVWFCELEPKPKTYLQVDSLLVGGQFQQPVHVNNLEIPIQVFLKGFSHLA